jgi:Peptidase family M1 domain
VKPREEHGSTKKSVRAGEPRRWLGIQRKRLGKVLVAAAGAIVLAAVVPGARAQTEPPGQLAFRATHYVVDATINPADQMLTASATVTLQAQRASREVVVELHPDLEVKSITLNGTAVTSQREASNPLELHVLLPNLAPAGQELTLRFAYAGTISNPDDSPVKGVRLANISSDGAYLLLPARWFPLTGYPSDRFTSVFNLKVPNTFAVVGTGTAGVPTPVAGPAGKAGAEGGKSWLLYNFVCDDPGPVGTFVAGKLELVPVTAGGVGYSIYVAPSATKTAQAYGQALNEIVTFYSSTFGPLPNPALSVAQLPKDTVRDFSAPGLLLLGPQEWTEKPNQRALARLAAEQWWHDRVLPATSADVWLSDGLARYSEALYEESESGSKGLHSVLEDCAVGALMDEEAAPIAQAWRLQPFTEAYRSIVVNKGAMVFHMLRTAMGDQPFADLLREYYQAYAGKSASLDDFEKLAAAKIAASSAPAGMPRLNLLAFFTQWIRSTGVPEFHLEYIVYRTAKGFKVVGKVKQELETLNMPIQVEVEAEGNPVRKTIQVVGTNSEFEVDTFGRPKPAGIHLDPDNDVLKSTPQLRVRAMVAYGEELAEEGQFYDAVHQYQRALDIQGNNSLALFRMGEVMFYQQNYQAAANAFRDALDGDLSNAYKWVEVWSHIYLGKIFDLTGQRDRALNEYEKAIQTKDDTGGAQEEANRYLQKPYTSKPGAQPPAKAPEAPKLGKM